MCTFRVPSAEALANVSSVVGQNASAVTAALWPLNVCLSFQPCQTRQPHHSQVQASRTSAAPRVQSRSTIAREQRLPCRQTRCRHGV